MNNPVSSFPSLSRPLTTIDFFKAVAVIVMIVDHVGFYLLPEAINPVVLGDPHMWLRVIGRWGLPVWFFLVGYAMGRGISWSLLLGGLILIAANLVTGMFVFPLNALFSMMIIRLIIDPVAKLAFGSGEGFFLVLVSCLIFLPFSNYLCEYGTVGLLLALAGYAVRHAPNARALNLAGQMPNLLGYRYFKDAFLWGVFVITVLAQMLVFMSMDGVQMWVMTIGMAIVFAALCYVPFTTYPDLTHRLPRWVVLPIQFMGCRTMEIYVAHLTLFKLVALIFGLGYPIYGWFEWNWMVTDSFKTLENR